MLYNITAYNTSGDVVYQVVANTEEQMIQEIKDAMHDGFPVLVCPTENKGV